MSKQASSRRKRQRTNNVSFGEASEDDTSSTQNNTSSSTLCTRQIPPTTVPALTTLCARRFTAQVKKLSSNDIVWERTREQLKVLPETLVPKLFAMLRESCPTLLNRVFISAYFFRGPSIVLSNSLPDITQTTIITIASSGKALRELELTGFSKIPDNCFASTIKSLPSLRLLNLRGCSKVGIKATAAIGKSCPLLTVINLSGTAATPVSLVPLALGCPGLEVLKVADIPNWTDANFAKFLTGVTQHQDFKFERLRTLKMRQASLSDSSLQSVIAMCPNLQRLDVSFTLVIHPMSLLQPSKATALQKLSLTSTRISSADVLAIISNLSQLKTLSLGGLGERQGSSATMGNNSALTMTNDTLRRLTQILEGFEHLENISLVGNAKLGLTERADGALSDFIRRVGRKCKSLNLAAIQSLHSAALAGLLQETVEQAPSQLQTLVLKLTGVDDEAAPFISSCVFLETLDVSGTKFTKAGLFPIIDVCSKLHRLDLTSCRGVNVVERRRFFEVWEKERRSF